MSQTLDDLIDNLRIRLDEMRPELRVETLYLLQAGFCRHCGKDEPDGKHCHCENEE